MHEKFKIVLPRLRSCEVKTELWFASRPPYSVCVHVNTGGASLLSREHLLMDNPGPFCTWLYITAAARACRARPHYISTSPFLHCLPGCLGLRYSARSNALARVRIFLHWQMNEKEQTNHSKGEVGGPVKSRESTRTESRRTILPFENIKAQVF